MKAIFGENDNKLVTWRQTGSKHELRSLPTSLAEPFDSRRLTAGAAPKRLDPAYPDALTL
ncbi:hypothetical protein RB2708 [Rhodopirellula baltica SH 1]|uniref:Uncharacterized protein n=1 Tax=Rhodopirellula baltica (strain DSM 10527 / NCIMB 13988 / SH1) TaxID=243090 RepID=Q7UVD3_RHOBA|nr:hypothetical protein RB2708 [Rhodopirellula baltica SH 1]